MSMSPYGNMLFFERERSRLIYLFYEKINIFFNEVRSEISAYDDWTVNDHIQISHSESQILKVCVPYLGQFRILAFSEQGKEFPGRHTGRSFQFICRTTGFETSVVSAIT